MTTYRVLEVLLDAERGKEQFVPVGVVVAGEDGSLTDRYIENVRSFPRLPSIAIIAEFVLCVELNAGKQLDALKINDGYSERFRLTEAANIENPNSDADKIGKAEHVFAECVSKHSFYKGQPVYSMNPALAA